MSRDPYRYFRIEAREIVEGLGQGVLELEKSPSKEIAGRLLRLAHTLKGAARVVKQLEIADAAHALEGALTPYRGGGAPITPELSSELLRVLDGIGERLSRIDGAPAGAPPEQPSPRAAGARDPPLQDERFETVRVEVEEMDARLDGVSEAAVRTGSLRREAARLEEAIRTAAALSELLGQPRPDGKHPREGPNARERAADLRTALEHVRRDLAAGIETIERELDEVRGTASRLRLQPASALFGPLERAARDVAQSLNKKVDVETAGGDVRIDTHVLAALREALLQIVRNAVAHGIESEGERVAAGKPPSGRVQIAVERRGSRVGIVCQDDGRGIDLDAVRRVAVRRGFIAASDATTLALEQAVSLLLRGGVSTARAVTEVAGRGVGLDVVRDVVARLKGEVAARSEPGRGTTIDLSVPVSLSSLLALAVEAGGISASVPLDGVLGAVRVAEADVVRSGETDSILHEGRSIPFLPLVRLFGKGAPSGHRPRSWSAVVVRSGAALVAIGVDRLLGTTRAVVRPLPALVGAVPAVAGASFDPEGTPRIVLDPAGLVEVVRARRKEETELAPARRPPVLVVDDSLTTRMLERSILESAGYEVDVVTSAEEALEKTRGRRYGVFVVDVEMPGMDGFELVARTRRDPATREVPAILVTSRGSNEDRRRGAEVGAHAYIAKDEFDEGRLLTIVRGLIG